MLTEKEKILIRLLATEKNSPLDIINWIRYNLIKEARRDFAEKLTNGLERFYIDKGFICKDSHTRINIGNLKEHIKRKLKEINHG